jgi:UDP-N-acetyl-D-galactosamine dehydrogenase
MGLAFKENCPDIRNTKVIDLINEFKVLKCNVDIYDPWVNKEDAMNEYKLQLINKPYHNKYDAIVLAVAHDKIREISLEELKTYGKDSYVIYDVKYLFESDDVDGRL